MADNQFSLEGVLDINTAQQTYTKMRRAIDQGTSHFDLAKLQGCDSAGLAALIEAKKYAKKKKQLRVTFSNASPQVQQFATFLKVNDLLFKSDADA